MRFLFLLITLLWTSAVAAEEPRTIDWEALIPEGDSEELDELYAAYYASLQGANPTSGQSLYDLGNSSSFGDIEEGSAQDVMPQIGTFNVVEELDGQRVRIPGFVLPFEYAASGKITEFLLVPYFGACIHTPPPPPNQIVYVTAEKPEPLGDQWAPIWATGILRAKSKMNNLGDAAYTLEIESWETYDG